MKNKFKRFLAMLLAMCLMLPTLAGCVELDDFFDSNDDGENTPPPEPSHTHVFDKFIPSDEFLYSDATTDKKAVYYVSCACGEKGTETFEHGDFATDGIIFIEVDGQYYVNGYDGFKTEITIPATYQGCSVVGVYPEAFKDYNNLTKIQLPSTIKSIQTGAFSSCDSLVSVNIPTKIKSIPDNAFRDCKALSSIILPNSLTNIGAGAFYGCTSLTSVKFGNQLSGIGTYAFYNCSSLQPVSLPSTISIIGAYAFYDTGLSVSDFSLGKDVALGHLWVNDYVASGNDDYGEEQIDENRTQIYVTLRNDGLGVDWMKKDIKVAYERFHPDIQIIVDTNYRDGTLQDMPSDKNQIYFNARDSYMEFANSGNLANIGEWVTEKVYDENYNYVGAGNGTVSIVDRMPEDFAKLYNIDGKYYGTPHYEGTFGIWYDYDLLGPNDLDLLNYGNGPDGIAGTPDDGLPRNFTEFKDLIQKIKNANCVPFTMSSIDYVRNGMLDAFYANYEGKNDFDINFSFNGTLQTPIDGVSEINANPGTANFELLTKQKGRLAALAMINQIVANLSESDGSLGHTAAQNEFVYSITQEGKRIAMFMEGAYWHNEARPIFNEMGFKNPSHAYGERDFRYMALPKFQDGEVAGLPASKNTGRTTLFSTGSDAFIFVNKKAENSKEVKEFYQWLNGNEGCYYFTKGSCTFRTIKTKFTDDQISSFAPVTQNLYAYRCAENTDMCYELSTCKTRYNQFAVFLQFDDLATVGGSDRNNPWQYLKDHPGDIDAFYEGYYTYWSAKAPMLQHLG